MLKKNIKKANIYLGKCDEDKVIGLNLTTNEIEIAEGRKVIISFKTTKEFGEYYQKNCGKKPLNDEFEWGV